MRYADIHCHLDKLENPLAALERAQETGVELVVTNATGPEDADDALAFSRAHEGVECALGLYPNQALELSQEARMAFYDRIRKESPVALGEIGLDYHWDDGQKELMRTVFSEQLSLAVELGLPVIIHSRKAEADVIDLLAEHDVTADLHCFSGKLSLARKAAEEEACYFSIPSNIVKSTHFMRLVEEVPLDQLLLETDAPYLSPDDEENEPANVVLAAQKIAEIKGLSVLECAERLWTNAQRFLS